MVGRFIAVVGLDARADNAALLETARATLQGEERFVFVKPVTTQPDTNGDESIYLNAREFAAWERGGRFALTWLRGGASVGIKREVLTLVNGGSTVIASMPQSSLVEARREFQSRLAVISVATPRQARAARLAGAGAGVEERGASARRGRRGDLTALLPMDFVEIDGDREPDDVLKQFIDALRLFAR